MADTPEERLAAIACLAWKVLGACHLTREVGAATPALLARVGEDEAFCSAIGRGACAALHMPEVAQREAVRGLEQRLLEWHALGGFAWIQAPASNALPN